MSLFSCVDAGGALPTYVGVRLSLLSVADPEMVHATKTTCILSLANSLSPYVFRHRLVFTGESGEWSKNFTPTIQIGTTTARDLELV